MAVGSLSNTRMLRSLLALIIIVVTIFIYALYSTTSMFSPELPIPQQITPHSGRQQQKIVAKLIPSMEMGQLNNTGEFGLASEEDEQELLRNPYSDASDDSSPPVQPKKDTGK